MVLGTAVVTGCDERAKRQRELPELEPVAYLPRVRLRCPECQTVVTVDDATPPERLPTFCTR